MTTASKSIESIVKQWVAFDMKKIQVRQRNSLMFLKIYLNFSSARIGRDNDRNRHSRWWKWSIEEKSCWIKSRISTNCQRSKTINNEEFVNSFLLFRTFEKLSHRYWNYSKAKSIIYRNGAELLKRLFSKFIVISANWPVTKTKFVFIHHVRTMFFSLSLKDPVPALEYAQNLQKRAEKVSDLEVENEKLRETLSEIVFINRIDFSFGFFFFQLITITNLLM